MGYACHYIKPLPQLVNASLDFMTKIKGWYRWPQSYDVLKTHLQIQFLENLVNSTTHQLIWNRSVDQQEAGPEHLRQDTLFRAVIVSVLFLKQLLSKFFQPAHKLG